MKTMLQHDSTMMALSLAGTDQRSTADLPSRCPVLIGELWRGGPSITENCWIEIGSLPQPKRTLVKGQQVVLTASYFYTHSKTGGSSESKVS